MRRREFITLFGGAAAAWALAVRAEQAGDAPRIGYIWIGNPGNDQETLAGIRQGLQDRGYVFGRNLMLETVPSRMLRAANSVVVP